MNETVLETILLSKCYLQGKSRIEILKDVNFSLKKGEIVALVGPSGSGKTSFLNILGMLDIPSSGEVLINNKPTVKLKDSEKTKLRGMSIGFVFQFHYLLPDFTALENTILPQIIHGISKAEAKDKSIRILTSLGLKHRLHHYPSTLSGGEQQRVAISRALSCNPSIIIADEPTGNLDVHTAHEVFNIFLDLSKQQKVSTIIATHDTNLVSMVRRKVKLENKQILDF